MVGQQIKKKKLAIKWQTASKSIVINAMGQKYRGKTLNLITLPNRLLFKDEGKITGLYTN